MIRIFRLYGFMTIAAAGIGCAKFNPSGSAALTIVNAIDSNSYIITNFEPIGPKGTLNSLQYFATANQISYGNSWESGNYVDSVSLSIFQNTDTVSALWSGSFNIRTGSIHTLFLSGDTLAIDTLFTTDIIPYYPFTDSLAGVRIINLSKGSLPMSVDIQGNPPTQYEFSNLGYQQSSTFKQYPASSNSNLAQNGITFEIRDQASGTLLTTIAWSYTIFKNNTIVIAGSENPNSNTPIQAFQVNNF
jgi:hypothetical protein